MDDKDPPVPASLFSSSSSSSPFPSRVSQDPHTVHLCKSLLSLPEQLEQLESGRYADENDSGSGVFEVNIDRLRGSVEVRRLREIPRGLETAAREARECVADQIAKRKQDIAILEQDSASLNTRMEKSEDEALFKQLCGIRKMIGKYKDELWELERKYTVEVEVEVERVSTRVEVVKEESVKVEKEKKLLPLTDVGIYVLAGYGGRHDATLLTIERYDAAQNSWTEVAASMSCARHCHASAVIGHDIYAIGGITAGGIWSSVERFSSTPGKWERVSPMLSPRFGSVAGVLHGRIYVAGGHDINSFFSSVTRFDVAANRWEEVASLSCARFCPGGAVLGGLFYVLGGSKSSSYDSALCTVERYDASKNEWSMAAPMKTARMRCAAAVLNGSIYAIGGFGLHGARVDSVERLDPTTNRWEEVAPLAQARSGACAAVLDGRLYVMGGANEVNTGLSSVERYDASRGCWERVADMTSARIHASAAVSR